MQRIKKGDTVQVITGNEIGARGEVEKILVDWYVDRDNRRVRRNPDGDKLVVRGVNIRKKHQRPISQTRTQTGIIEREAPVHISNVMLVCPNCDEASRVGFRIEGDKKLRFCKRCGTPIDKVS
ncbi:MAG: 50S ribosomal protein L24 [Anaerolineae bacterium]|jgi:large subunit ribosomal protein L24|nr:50S ribosomal protein L24 [Anaerolineales bacterium]MCQ3973163.1 50S ribosomal protein L24 [Anaerolineae bacterium]